jgi:hypothetical protein
MGMLVEHADYFIDNFSTGGFPSAHCGLSMTEFRRTFKKLSRYAFSGRSRDSNHADTASTSWGRQCNDRIL